MGGEIQFIADAAQWAPFVDDGKCRILAFATEQRIERYKDVPTMIERGVNVVGQSPYGLVGPKNMPPEIVDAIYQAFRQAMTEPKVNEYLAKFIQGPWNKNPAEYRAFAEKYYGEVKPLLIKAGWRRPSGMSIPSCHPERSEGSHERSAARGTRSARTTRLGLLGQGRRS